MEDKDGRLYDPVHGLLESAGRSCCPRANKENDFKLHTFMLSHTALSGCGRYLGLIIVLEGRTAFFRIPSIAGLVFILVTIAAALTLGRCALWGRAAWPRCRTLVITRSVYALLVTVRQVQAVGTEDALVSHDTGFELVCTSTTLDL